MTNAPQIGQVVGGKYRVRTLLGEGGMGAVYEAVNESTGKRVALKWLHPHLVDNPRHRERFMREAKVLARVRHPNVVDLYDVGLERDTFFLVLEFLEGESLGALLDRELLPVATMVELLIGAMRGLAATHKQGIVHRDLKPDNIFLSRENDDGSLTPKLLDFGISKLAMTDSGAIKLTATGSVLGTLRYMSYEQLMGHDVDARTDVYSFGVILYEALTGQSPYPASSFHQLIVQFQAMRPTPPRELRPEIPPALERVIMSALSQERSLRPQSIDALIQAVMPFRSSARAATQAEARIERRTRADTQASSRRAPSRDVTLSSFRQPRLLPMALGALATTAVAAVAWYAAGGAITADASGRLEDERTMAPPALPMQATLSPAAASPAVPAERAVDAGADIALARPTPSVARPAALSVVRARVQSPQPAAAPKEPAPSPQPQPMHQEESPARRRRTPRLSAEEF
jgi:serine/threonine protein kinase